MKRKLISVMYAAPFQTINASIEAQEFIFVCCQVFFYFHCFENVHVKM